MKRSKKNDDEQLKTLLQQNIPPKPDSQKRQMLIRKLSADAADMDYLEPESFSEKILTTGQCHLVRFSKKYTRTQVKSVRVLFLKRQIDKLEFS